MYETVVTGKAPKAAHNADESGAEGDLPHRKQHESSVHAALNRALTGGVGWKSIYQFLKGGKKESPIGADAIMSAVATLKASVQYAQLMGGVIARRVLPLHGLSLISRPVRSLTTCSTIRFQLASNWALYILSVFIRIL